MFRFGNSSAQLIKERLQFGLFILLSDIVGLPILRVSLSGYLERLGEDGFAVRRLLALDCVFDGEDVFASLLSALKVRATAFRFPRIKFDGVLGTTKRLGGN